MCCQGIEVAQLKEGIMISWKNYILDLKEIGLLGFKPTNTPIKVGHKLDEGLESPLVERERYQCFIDKLIYLLHTRPYIAYAPSMVS